jgi:hypothetical protein
MVRNKKPVLRKCKYCEKEAQKGSDYCSYCKEKLPLVRKLIRMGSELREILEKREREESK